MEPACERRAKGGLCPTQRPNLTIHGVVGGTCLFAVFLRGVNLMNSLGQYRSAKLRRRGGVCQPVRIVAKEVADGRKKLPKQVISSPQVGGMGVGVIRPEANAPHLVERAGFS